MNPQLRPKPAQEDIEKARMLLDESLAMLGDGATEQARLAIAEALLAITPHGLKWGDVRRAIMVKLA